jgi:hypothetical protein
VGGARGVRLEGDGEVGRQGDKSKGREGGGNASDLSSRAQRGISSANRENLLVPVPWSRSLASFGMTEPSLPIALPHPPTPPTTGNTSPVI